MNTDEGIYEHIGDAPQNVTTLFVGEVVQIKGEQHRVTEIKDRHVTLELMSIEDRIDELYTPPVRNRHERRAFEKQARKR